jgi:predicted DNA-binding transcriptional regulator AlpA
MTLQILRPDTPSTAPVDRGRLLTASQVATECFSGTVSATWVKRRVPGKLILGHSTVRWYEADVLGWIADRGAKC